MTIPLRYDVLTEHQAAIARTYLARRAVERTKHRMMDDDDPPPKS